MSVANPAAWLHRDITMTANVQPTPPAAPAAPAASPPAPAPTSHVSRPIRWAVWCVIGAAAIVAASVAVVWFTDRLSHSITDDAFVEAHIVNVAPEMVSGRIVRFLVEENDQVEQGQVLAEIDPSTTATRWSKHAASSIWPRRS